MCGYVFDEEKEGTAFDPAAYSCVMCGTPGEKFIRLDDEPEPAEAPARSQAPDDPLAYPADTFRQDPTLPHMDQIHEMALTGRPISAAMGTRLPLPSWDDILVLGAQLDPMPLADDAEVDCTTVIGPNARQPMVLANPLLVSHMSFGALSRETKHALARGAAKARCGTESGEGGVLPEEQAAAYRYVFEYVPNRYSVTDDNLRAADAIEVKVGQGTKPGMGGHLPGEKCTADIARFRGVEVGTTVQSPSRFPGIEDRDDLARLIDDLRRRSEGRPIGIKLAAGHIEDDLAFALDGRPDFVTFDGRGGATGSSPVMLRDAASVPTIFALARARAYLDKHAPQTSLIITGGLRVSSDFVKALAMGADAVAVASAVLMAAGCQQYRICGSGMCPAGIATQDEGLRRRLDVDAAATRVANFLGASCEELRMFGRVTGHADIHDLSRKDLVTVDREIAKRCHIKRA
jgi:glutamate synthase domain-containing protein 2